MSMLKLLKFLFIGSLVATVLGSLGMRMVVRMRQVERVVPVQLSSVGDRPLPAGAAEQGAAILRERIAYLRDRHSVAKYSVAVLGPDKLEMRLLSHVNLDPLIKTLLARSAVELRLVLDYDYQPKAGQPVPDGAEVLDEVQWLYSTQHIGRIEKKHTPRLVSKTPAMAIERFESVKFTTRTLRRDPIIEVQMLPDDAKRFAELTQRSQGKHLAVVMDGEIRTAPLVEKPITGGRVWIQGIVFKQQARDIAAFLGMGALPCRASIAPPAAVALKPTNDPSAANNEATLK